MIRVLIADDHPIVRQGLKQILSESSDIIVAGEAGDCRETLEKLKKGSFDLVLLDINMPDRNGLELLAELKKEWPKVSVLILSAFPEEQYAVRALRSGASGYLVKKSAPEELITAIKKVSGGRKYITASLAERLASRLDADSVEAPHERLSNREYQVLCMIGSGKTVSEIAEELSLSVKTVSTHRSRILGKMEMKSNAEIIRYVVKNSLVE